MTDRPDQKERPYLLLAAAGNLIIGCVGLAVSVISSSQAIMLDGLFNLTYFIVGLFTLKVSRLVEKGDDDRFPHGYAFFEPLVNGIKGVLVLGISLMALAGAVEALFTGGRVIAAGAAISYGLFATVACGAMALITHRGRLKTNSPLVNADAKNWLVNTAISAAVLVAFSAILLIRDTPLHFLTPYVDPIVVLIVVLISISVPVRMAWRALMELLNRTPSPEIVDEVREIIDESTSGLPVKQLFVRVVQPGRTRMVLVHVVLPSDYAPGPLASLDALRMSTLERLREAHLATLLDMVFTADEKWGAPLSESSQGVV